MKNLSLFFTSLAFLLIIFGALILFLFWRLNIFKKETPPTTEILKIKTQLEFINSYPFGEVNNYVKNLSAQKIEIPSLGEGEIGRGSLF